MTVEPKAFVPKAVQVFNESSFYEKFLDDVRSAKALVILQSPFISRNRWTQISSNFRACVERHVCICIFLQDQGDCAEFQNCLVHLQNAGVHVNVRPSIHEKMAIIDEQILWDGSLNVLSHRNTRERMTRIQSREMVINAVIEHRVNQCDFCIARRGLLPNGGVTLTAEQQLKLIGQRIQSRRLDLDMTQRELARRASVSQQTVSSLEKGQNNVTLSALCSLCHFLDLEVRPIPWFYLSASDERLAD